MLALLPLVIPEVPSPDRIPPPQLVQVPVGSTTQVIGVIPMAQIPLPAVTAVRVGVSVATVGSFGDALSVAYAREPEGRKEDNGSNQHKLPHSSPPSSDDKWVNDLACAATIAEPEGNRVHRKYDSGCPKV